MFAQFHNRLSQRIRHCLPRRRFLCPHCLRFSKYRLACGACWLKVEDALVRANGDCPRCRQPLQENVRAWCQRCWCGCDNAAYHQRPVRVLAMLWPVDFASFCHATGVQQTQKQGVLGYFFNNGTWLAYVLNLSDLTEAESLLRTDVFQELEAIWVDAAESDMQELSLSLIDATDRFIRHAGLTEGQRQALTVCLRQTALEPVVEQVLTARFGTIRYGVEAADFLSDGAQAQVRDLGAIKHNPTVLTHIAALKGSEYQRKWTAEALGKVGNQAAVPAFISYSRRSRAAVDALGRIGDKSAVPALIAALKNTNTTVFTGIRSLDCDLAQIFRMFGPFYEYENRCKEMRLAATEALKKISDQSAVPALIDALKSSDADVRYCVAEVLMKIGDQSVVPTLIAALKDRDRWVRYCAAEALGNIGVQFAVPALIAALKDRADYVRRAAAAVLGRIGEKAAVTGGFSNGRMRYHAAEALKKISNESIVPALIAAFKDRDSEVRYHAVEALGKIGDESAVPALIAASKDSPIYVRKAAVDALGSIGKPAMPALISELRDRDSWVRYCAVAALVKIDDEVAIIRALRAADREYHSRFFCAFCDALRKLGAK